MHDSSDSGTVPDVWWNFDDQRATQAAAFLLKLAGGRLNYTVAIKLLYFADREALVAYGSPITGAQFYSLKYGPVLSEVYELIKERRRSDIWSRCLRTEGRDLVLVGDPGDDDLCDADEALLRKHYEENRGRIDEQHGQPWSVIDHAHKEYPEWTDPGSSSTWIDPRTVLRCANVSEAEIDAIRRELTHVNSVQFGARGKD